MKQFAVTSSGCPNHEVGNVNCPACNREYGEYPRTCTECGGLVHGELTGDQGTVITSKCDTCGL